MKGILVNIESTSPSLPEWRIIEDRGRGVSTIEAPDGRSARFSAWAIGDLMIELGMPSLPSNPFEAFAFLLSHGLKPMDVAGQELAESLALPGQK